MRYLSGALLLCACAASVAGNSTTYLWELGLPSEEHDVITEDGYVLALFRIPRPGAIPVLLMHGFMGTSDMWLLMEKENNIATILYDKGYDVWIANMRGNVHSHRHVSLSTSSNNFPYWDFSIDEIAQKDLPAVMSRITAQTGKAKMFYIGHSMGSTVFFIYCSVNPRECDRFYSAVMLAPIAFPPERVRLRTVDLIVQWGSELSAMLRKMRIYEFLGRNQAIIRSIHESCASDYAFMCRFALQVLFNFDKANSLPRPLSDYLSGSFGGTSVKVFDHISSIISKEGVLGPYNSTARGIRRRAARTYNLENIAVPLGLISGADDIFVDEEAMKRLRPKLKKIVFDIIIPAPFKHLGYFYDVKTNYGMVTEILNLLKEFNDPSNSLI